VLATTVTAQLSTTPRHKVTDTLAFANAAATAALVEPPTDSKASSRSSSAGLLLAAAADLMLQPLTTATATAAIVAADHCPFHDFFPSLQSMFTMEFLRTAFQVFAGARQNLLRRNCGSDLLIGASYSLFNYMFLINMSIFEVNIHAQAEIGKPVQDSEEEPF
jgi:hypothetical protein